MLTSRIEGRGVSLSEYISPLVGRLVLAWYFAGQAWLFGHRWDASIADLAARHVPVPALVLVLALTVMVLGALALVLGYQARHGAVLLFAFVLIASVALHDFWIMPEGAPRDAEFAIFARNMAIAGGLLMIVGLGPGRFAIDNRGGRGH
jgi:putative oxidoreductase